MTGGNKLGNRYHQHRHHHDHHDHHRHHHDHHQVCRQGPKCDGSNLPLEPRPLPSCQKQWKLVLPSGFYQSWVLFRFKLLILWRRLYRMVALNLFSFNIGQQFFWYCCQLSCSTYLDKGA